VEVLFVCGIIAVVPRRSLREPASSADTVAALERVVAALDGTDVERLRAVAAELSTVDSSLRGVSGVRTLLADAWIVERITHTVDQVAGAVAEVERTLEGGGVGQDELEATNALLSSVKDAAWALERDRLRAARCVAELAGPDATAAAVAAMFAVHQALSAIDRLEVRGRDSAGVELIVRRHDLDLTDASVRSILDDRGDALFASGSVRVAGDQLVFVYKAAAEIGELGDNTASLRDAIRKDELLAEVLSGADTEVIVLGHTRWASVGIISEPNAHPQGSDEVGVAADPFVTAVLNGDVDNFPDLIAADDLAIAPAITTDAKVIPALVTRRRLEGRSASEAFRETVASLEGSVAIGLSDASELGVIRLALYGSGQALYVGLADDAFIVASEPYGLVEETSTYLRMDGETPANPDNPSASRGQIVELDAADAGTIAGIRRWSYDGTELPVTEAEFAHAEITTRDIDRGEFPHFLLKEISDAPGSFRKTLRGKLIERDGRSQVVVGESTLPPSVHDALASGRINKIVVIGQGTAAIAGQSLAAALAPLLADTPVRVSAAHATELSGFSLEGDMSDTLVIAISQSGTTTDTNRTVDLARGRGARVLAIVNRRNSDLCDKSDGVLFTSDGRDVEMSVASTKAFYAQIAAGLLLSVAIADIVPGGRRSDRPETQALLAALRELPDLMSRTLELRDEIAVAARQFAPSRRYWAIVGNGVNQIAAREIRVKLSELCYKSIACDATEDKKHIDLSSEPLILVCAAGLVGSTADDVTKEVAIFRAHKAAPIVICSVGARPPAAALHVVTVPDTDPRLAFVLSAMVGHLFGYEAALAIDAQARPLREARGIIEHAAADNGTTSGEAVFAAVKPRLVAHQQTFADGLRSGSYNGHLEAGTAVRVASLFRFACGISPLDAYQSEFGKVGTPGVVLDDLTSGLTAAIEELTRPVDAIKHQAKTVTVGISRSDESVLQVPLVAAALRSGAPRDRLSYSTLRALADLDPAVAEVVGSTRYRVEGTDMEHATSVVIDQSGLAVGLRSRTERDPRLRGTKHLVAREQELMITVGASDGRTVLIVPETKDGATTGLTLLHLRLNDRLPAATMRGVLQGYRRRFQALRDAVTETEDVFREDLLADEPVVDLLCDPILDLAGRWRS
jgi:glucosamine--fructose-6-phosphate aminotransferase (isomerizing)